MNPLLLPLEVPVRIGRDEAQRRAAEELAKAKYGGTPEWLVDLAERADSVGSGASSSCSCGSSADRVGSGGGVNWGFVRRGAASCLVAIVLVVWRVGLPRWRRAPPRRGAWISTPTRPAADYRGRPSSTRPAATGRPRSGTGSGPWSASWRLQTILDVRPARTAWEAAYRASQVLPTCRESLQAGAESFNAVVYGDRPADSAAYQQMVAVDEQVTTRGRPGRPRRRRTGGASMSARSTVRRRTRWVVGVILVVGLVVSAVLVVVGTADRQQADDPRSSTRRGAGALGALLAAEGVRSPRPTGSTTRSPPPAPTGPWWSPTPTGSSEADARRLLTAGYGRVILLRPNAAALAAFGVRAAGGARSTGSLARRAARSRPRERAGTITAGRRARPATSPPDRPSSPATRLADGGTPTCGSAPPTGTPVELVGGGIANELARPDGNAAFAHERVRGAGRRSTWLMARRRGRADSPTAPTLLPPWWPIALAQAAVALRSWSRSGGAAGSARS